MLRATTGLHTNQAGLKFREKRQQLRPSQGPIESDLVVLSNPVNLKNVLGQIEADCGNLHWVAPPI
ncbi:MAG: hypothetical protein ABJH45_06440, partial [Paracoccaceae bacterium]